MHGSRSFLLLCCLSSVRVPSCGLAQRESMDDDWEKDAEKHQAPVGCDLFCPVETQLRSSRSRSILPDLARRDSRLDSSTHRIRKKNTEESADFQSETIKPTEPCMQPAHWLSLATSSGRLGALVVGGKWHVMASWRTRVKARAAWQERPGSETEG